MIRTWLRRLTRRGLKRLVATIAATSIAGGGVAWHLPTITLPNAHLSLGTGAAAADEPAAPDTPAADGDLAETLESLPVKGKAPKTGYSRDLFGQAWTDDNDDEWGRNGLDTRSDLLSESLTDVVCKTPPTKKSAPHCVVQSGTLHDPYTGKTIHYERGPKTGSAVQADHIVPLGLAYQTGAQKLTPRERVNLANDPLELVAVDGPTNEAKGDSDAATWLPPNKAFRCEYVSRQIRVKAKYRLWVTPPEKEAMLRVLSTCPADGDQE